MSDSWGYCPGGSQYNPPFFKGACPQALTVDFCLVALEGHNTTLLLLAVGTSWEGRSIPHVRVAGSILPSHLLHGATYPFHSPHYVFVWPCLPWPSLVSGSIPLLVPLSASCQWVIDVIPLPYVHVPSKVCSQITLPVVLHPSSVDCSGRCPQSKPQLPIFSTTGKLFW